MKLRSERLLLRRITSDDAKSVYAYRTQPEVAQFQGWEPSSIGEVENLAQGQVDLEFDAPEVWHQLVICRSSDEMVVGDCGYQVGGEKGDEVELGVSIATEHQRMGYANGAIELLLAFLFRDLGLRRVVASIDPRNKPSLALFEKLGFRREGHFIASYWFKGAWVDDVRFAMLRDEFPRP